MTSSCLATSSNVTNISVIPTHYTANANSDNTDYFGNINSYFKNHLGNGSHNIPEDGFSCASDTSEDTGQVYLTPSVPVSSIEQRISNGFMTSQSSNPPAANLHVVANNANSDHNNNNNRTAMLMDGSSAASFRDAGPFYWTACNNPSMIAMDAAGQNPSGATVLQSAATGMQQGDDLSPIAAEQRPSPPPHLETQQAPNRCRIAVTDSNESPNPILMASSGGVSTASGGGGIMSRQYMDESPFNPSSEAANTYTASSNYSSKICAEQSLPFATQWSTASFPSGKKTVGFSSDIMDPSAASFDSDYREQMKLVDAGRKSNFSPASPNQTIAMSKSNDTGLVDGVKSYLNNAPAVPSLPSNLYQPSSSSTGFSYISYAHHCMPPGSGIDKKLDGFKKERGCGGANSMKNNNTYGYDQNDSSSSLLQQHQHLVQQSSANQMSYFTPPDSFEGRVSSQSYLDNHRDMTTTGSPLTMQGCHPINAKMSVTAAAKPERFTSLVRMSSDRRSPTSGNYFDGVSNTRSSPYHKASSDLVAQPNAQQQQQNDYEFYANPEITVKSEVPAPFQPDVEFIDEPFSTDVSVSSRKQPANAFNFSPINSTSPRGAECVYSGVGLPPNGQMYFSGMASSAGGIAPYKNVMVDRYHPYNTLNDNPSSLTAPMSIRPLSEGLCAVCGDNAACQHYGVRTCEGCKGFFKRTVQKQSTYVCLANKNCPVDKRRRNRCQFCRYEKCLAVGMVKEVVRTDHLKGRRGRLPSKPKGPKDPVARPSPPVPFITSLVQAHICTNPAIANIDTSKYRPPCMQQVCNPSFSITEEAAKFYHLLESCLMVTRMWAEKIPGFAVLCPDDQTALIETSFFEIFVLRLAFRSEIQEGKLIFCNGLALHHGQLHGMFDMWTEQLTRFIVIWNDLNVDLSSYSCLLAFVLVQDCGNVRDMVKVKDLQRMVMENLTDFTTNSPLVSDRQNFLHNLLSMVNELRKTAAGGIERLHRLHAELPSVPLPKTVESLLKRKVVMIPPP